MKWYDYLIAYRFEKDENGTTTNHSGSVQLSRKRKINSFEEVDSVRDFLTKRNAGAKNLMINNIMYLGKNHHD